MQRIIYFFLSFILLAALGGTFGFSAEFDTLEYVHKLKEAGVPEKQAEIHAKALSEIVQSNLAIRQEIEKIKANFLNTPNKGSALTPSDKLRIQKDITKSSGGYTCPTCSSAQEWYIDENHVLYWQGNPYVPHAVNDFPYQLPFDEQPVEEIIAGIDTLFMQGVSDFYVDFGALPRGIPAERRRG